MNTRHALALIAALSTAACSPKNTKVYAQEKEYVPPEASAPWKIAGVFDQKELTIAISVNGESVIRSRFPPFTPRISAEGKYEGKTVQTLCMFSSDVIAGRKAGFQLQIAEAIVSKATKTGGNTCEVKVDQQPAATLYF